MGFITLTGARPCRRRARAKCSCASHASGVCRSDYNAIDGTAESPCPVVLGHEGAGVVEAVGPGVTRVVAGDHVALSWTPSCGECAECVRGLPQLCATVWPAMDKAGLMDGTSRLSRDGEPRLPLLVPLLVRRGLRRPGALVRAHPTRRAVRRRGPRRLRRHDGRRGGLATAGVRPGDRVAVIGCGGVGLSALLAAAAVGAEPVIAVDIDAGQLDAAQGFGASDGVVWAGNPEATAAAVREASGGGVDYAFEATGRPGDAGRRSFPLAIAAPPC